MHLGGGFLAMFGGRTADAEREFATALDGFRALGDRWAMAQTLDPLAELADWRGDQATSGAMLDKALALLDDLGAVEDMAVLLVRRATGLLRAGSLAAARADHERAVELAIQAGAPETMAAAYCGLGEITRIQGDLAESRRLFELALGRGATGWFVVRQARARALIGLGRLAEEEGDADEARSWHGQALGLALDHHNYPAAATAVEGLAGVAVLERAGERAALLLGAATAVRGTALAGHPDVAQVTAGCEALIGTEAFAAAYRRGSALARDDALAMAGAASRPCQAG
jgi:tetratricopeptide (TPR) repeat protein